MDSGSFTELTLNGGWTLPPQAYAEQVQDIAQRVGRLEWVAPQDWMCEPHMIERTGLSVREHQERTVSNFLSLKAVLGHQVIPVLQGWTLTDYERCVSLYESAGVTLGREPLVGLGTVCRRQATGEISRIVHGLAERGLALHGFGVKLLGLARYGQVLASADSMAWSFSARRGQPLVGCRHRTCANCFRFASRWRQRVLGMSDQQSLFCRSS
jgi:hypothetical protein